MTKKVSKRPAAEPMPITDGDGEYTSTAAQEDDASATNDANGPQEEQKPVIALFGQIGFRTVEDFDAYTQRMKEANYNDILVTINYAVRGAIQRGTFSAEETEAASVALRNLNKAFTVAEPQKG